MYLTRKQKILTKSVEPYYAADNRGLFYCSIPRLVSNSKKIKEVLNPDFRFLAQKLIKSKF